MLCSTFADTMSMSMWMSMSIAVAAQPGAGGGQDFAQRQYDTALAFMRSGRADEAIKDFQAIADNYPSSAVADQALLQMATYYWEHANDAVHAKTAIDQLLRLYGTGRAAPYAHLLNGRIALAAGASDSTSIEAALASFERARRLFPSPEVAAAAAYYSGEALRSAGRCPDAAAEYATVLVDHPRMVWAGRAELGIARCLIAQHQPRAALSHLQRARQYPDLPANDLTRAARWQTIVARFYLRAAADPAFVFGSNVTFTSSAAAAAAAGGNNPSSQPSRAPRDIVAIATDASDHLHVLTESALLTYDAQGRAIASFTANEPRALAVDAEGRPIVVEKNGLRNARGQPISLSGAGSGSGSGSSEPLNDLTAACALSNGELMLTERRSKRLHHLAVDGHYLGPLASLQATRIAANDRDEVVALDRDTKSLVLMDRQGATVRRIAARGDGYQFDNVVDVTIDPLGHIYALDRGQATVFVFTNDGKLLTSLRSPESGDGSFREPTAFAIDAAGRLFVADARTHQVVIYQ